MSKTIPMDNDATNRQSPRIIIIGGGIGGMSCAIFLRNRGFTNVQIFESKSKQQRLELTRRGNGIHIYFQCARMLKFAAGLTDLDKYITPQDIQMRRDDGKLMTDISNTAQLRVCPALNATKASVYSILRQNLYKLLLDAIPDDMLYCNKRCVGATEKGDENVTIQFDDGTTEEADFVIGADGINSVLATQIHGPRPVNKHDIVILQGLSDYVDDSESNIETWLLHRNGGTMGIVPVVLPSGKEGTFWWVTVRRSDLGNDTENDHKFFKLESDRYEYDVVPKVVALTDPSSLERWYSQDKDPLPRKHWSSTGSRIVLLGDACHAANPFSGYGAGMTIEDGYWLAKALDRPEILLNSRISQLREALKTYQRKRARYTAQIVHESRVLMRVLHPPNRFVKDLLNFIWGTGLPGPVIAKKFIKVYEVGLSETEWTEEEREAGKLVL